MINRIGLMGAMEEEVSSLKSSMVISETMMIGEREYSVGKLFGRETVLVYSRWGKVASASTVTTLINVFKVNQVIFTGVAGAVASHLNIGDVVIGTSLYQHDMNASPLFPQREIPLLGITFFPADEKLLDGTKRATEAFFRNAFSKTFDQDLLKSFSIDSPKVYLGKIATGDQFISTIEKTESLLHAVPDTLAVEMEGAAVAQVCFESRIPCIVIRTISDRANHEAPIDFPKFITKIAKLYSLGIVKNIYPLLSKE